VTENLFLDGLLVFVCLVFAAQIFYFVSYSPSKSSFWLNVVSVFKFCGDLDERYKKGFLYYRNKSGGVELQFNGARYYYFQDGLVIRPPIAAFGESIFLSWSEMRLGDRVKMPLTSWRFCDFQELFLDGVDTVVIVPDFVATEINKRTN